MDRSFVFRLPREIFFGWGEGTRTGHYVKRIASRFLLVTGKYAVRHFGIFDEITESLRNEGITWEVFDDVEPEPSLQTVDRALQHARHLGIEGVISLGGGSVLDCGKAVAGLFRGDWTVQSYFDGHPLPESALPWVALPTTAGTGSELTNNAVLTDPERNLKKSIRGFALMATLVIVDPRHTVSMDAFLTASSGIDALVQAMEAYTSPRANPIGDGLALEGICLLWENLPLAVKQGDNRLFRERVARGSLLSAMAFSNSSSGPAHGLSHMVGPEYTIAHGEACGLLLPHVIRYNRDAVLERYSTISTMLLGKGGSSQENVERLLKAWTDFIDNIGLRRFLRDFGATEKSLEGVVREELIGRNIKENPRPLNHDDLVLLLKEAL